MDPVVLFFALGAAARLVKSDLKLPEALYETLSIYLLLAIGLKGGIELAKHPLSVVAPQALAVMAMGFVLPLLAYPVLRRAGFFLVAFGVVVPVVFSCIEALLGFAIGLSVGGTALLAVLAASASYIAAPAALRIAVPEANPSLSIGAALGVTFPFNLTVGIPLYLHIAQGMHAVF